MPITLLLDLDDTLLHTRLDTFLPAYYDLLARDLADIAAPADLLAALRTGIELMLASRDATRTLQHVFDEAFFPRLAADPDLLRERILRFYREVFPGLCTLTAPRPGARELVDWALGAGHRVALATEPVFPLVATLERVRWAGLDPQQFELIASFETFHFTKQHPVYYAEVLGRLGWPDQPVIMAGDDPARDVLPARALGLSTFQLAVEGTGREAADGELGQLRGWIDAQEGALAVPALASRKAILAVMESTPAAAHGMTMGLDDESWRREPAPDEWAIIEVVCHLRDTEREVHARQIETLLESAEPFVARPDAAYWAKQRRYTGEDGPRAVLEFAAARQANLTRLAEAADDAWAKRARHAIFGPSSFQEVVGFMAEHDRLHLQQAWRTLRDAADRAHRN